MAFRNRWFDRLRAPTASTCHLSSIPWRLPLCPIHPHLSRETSIYWYPHVFSFRAAKNAKRTEAAAAIAIQRWQRQLVHARVESARAQQELARRRWAVGKLHAAYARRWRFQVATLRDRRRKFEAEEEVRFLSSSFGAWLHASNVSC